LSIPTWAGCAVPGDLLYDLELDVWVRLEGASAVVGMTDVAQTRCGRLVQVSWKRDGRPVRRGRPVCVIESSKWVGPVLSPLTGTLLASNEARFAQDIAIANRDPYGDGWLVRIGFEVVEELESLAGAQQAFEHYRRLIEAEDIHCFRCAD
jgi:glycine cleavage system H protein